MQDRVLFDTVSAAEYLGGLSKKTLERWRLDGKGPRYMKIGAIVRYPQEFLDEYLDSVVVRSTSEHKQAS